MIESTWVVLGPMLVAVAAWRACAWLIARVRSGRMARPVAALRYLPSLLLPLAFLAVLWLLSVLANRHRPPGSIWNGDAALGVVYLVGLLLLAVALSNLVFWIVLGGSGRPQEPATATPPPSPPPPPR